MTNACVSLHQHVTHTSNMYFGYGKSLDAAAEIAGNIPAIPASVTTSTGTGHLQDAVLLWCLNGCDTLVNV